MVGMVYLRLLRGRGPSLQVLEHLLLHDLRRLLAGKEGVSEIIGGVVVPDVLINPVELSEVRGLDVEDAEVLFESLGVGGLGDDAEIVVDSPRQDDLSRGLAVLLKEQTNGEGRGCSINGLVVHRRSARTYSRRCQG